MNKKEECLVDLQAKKAVKKRLEYLRGEIRGERISYGELVELQSLAKYIETGDAELSEAAGIPEDEFNRVLEKTKKEAYEAGKGSK